LNDKVFCYSLESVPIQSRTKRDRLKNQPDRAGDPLSAEYKNGGPDEAVRRFIKLAG
jgi:hypothetical protein